MAAWDITSYAYSGKSVDVSAISSLPREPFLKDDGLKLYFIDVPNDRIAEYAISTAWDVSTASLTTTFSVSSQVTTPSGLSFGNSGTKMYVVDIANPTQSVNEYTLSTAWNISTASFVQSFSVSSQDLSPRCVRFNTLGTKMFVAGGSGQDINEYTLSTAWNISTASFVDSFSVSSQTTSPNGLEFGDSGSKMYVSDATDVYEYTLSTAFDVSTASFVDSFDTSGQDTSAAGLFFRASGDNFYTAGGANDSIFQYRIIETITSAATMAGTSTLSAFPANAQVVATMAGTSAFSGAAASGIATKGRAADEASAGGTSAALAVSLNSAITEPANPSGNT